MSDSSNAQEPTSTPAPAPAPSRTSRERTGAGAPRWIAVVLLSLASAAALGWVATLVPRFADAPPWVVALSFALCTVTPIGALFYLFIIGPTLPTDPHAEENVENKWIDKAMAGAGVDTMGAAGIGIVVLLLAPVEMPAVWALTGVVALLMVDTVLRYVYLSRRNG